MDERDAIEQAYKNGFEAGIREFAERLKAEKFKHKNFGELVQVEDIDNLVEEMCGKDEGK